MSQSCWNNETNAVCCLCSNLDSDGTYYTLDYIKTVPLYLKDPVNWTSSDCLISVNDKLYCEDCWDNHIRTDELFIFELPESYMHNTIKLNICRIKSGSDPYIIHERNYNYWIQKGWMHKETRLYIPHKKRRYHKKRSK